MKDLKRTVLLPVSTGRMAIIRTVNVGARILGTKQSYTTLSALLKLVSLNALPFCQMRWFMRVISARGDRFDVIYDVLLIVYWIFD